MIDVILTDEILRNEWEAKTNPRDYSDIDAELQELLQRMKTFRDFISDPTLEQLENIDSKHLSEAVFLRLSK